MRHSTLVELGARWLQRRCSIVLTELSATPEIPDAIGWADGVTSFVVECKVTRADFLRDRDKSARKKPNAGMGNRRYYLCPANIIQIADLPPKWGLLWATQGQITVQREARGIPQRNLLAEVRYLSTMLRRAQIRIGTRPLSEWLRGENRFEAVRGVSPNRKVTRAANILAK